MDANSGFEPMTFTEETYHRWKPILKGPWRFAFDVMVEEKYVKRMIDILKDEPASKKRIFVLVGNEPMKQCIERIHKVIEWGCEPHVQPMMALNALEKRPMIKHDWTEQKLKDLARWSNRWLWRNIPLSEYAPRKDGIRPFA